MCDVTGLPLADHPIWWRDPVTPTHVGVGGLHLVPGGALASGTRADAVMALDTHEAKRRGDESLESVPSLAMLDVLLGLPLGCPIDVEDLTEHEVRMLRTAPHGCVEFTDTTVTRRLQVPTTVVAAVVRGTRWRTSLLRAAAFSAFTQRIVALKSPRELRPFWRRRSLELASGSRGRRAASRSSSRPSHLSPGTSKPPAGGSPRTLTRLQQKHARFRTTTRWAELQHAAIAAEVTTGAEHSGRPAG